MLINLSLMDHPSRLRRILAAHSCREAVHMAGSNVLNPDQIALLQKVVNRICDTRAIAPDSIEREDFAMRAMHFFQQGIVEEEALFEAASGKLGK